MLLPMLAIEEKKGAPNTSPLKIQDLIYFKVRRKSPTFEAFKKGLKRGVKVGTLFILLFGYHIF